MKKKKWNIAGYDSKSASDLAAEIGVSPLAAAVLCSRGIDTKEKADAFFDTSIYNLHDPFLIDGMEKAKDRILSAVKKEEKVAVYGDYDVDGVTATCVIVKYLRKMGVETTFYIPDRLNEGYGLNCAALKTIRESGVSLLITVDSGITAIEEARFAKSIGLDMIITDHHECREQLPEAVAVINPKRQENRYPFPNLAGVGVAFKLVCALAGEDSAEKILKEYGDLVAVGTVADIMPLVEENRVIVTHGINAINNECGVGLQALMAQSGLSGKRITTSAISFVLAPRINAAGRLGEAARAADLFLTDDSDMAMSLAEELCAQNRQRQAEENAIFLQVLERMKCEYDKDRDKIVVMWGDGWHNGVIGIVASKIADMYGVPVILISIDGDEGKGSGRSIPGVNLFEILEKASGSLTKYGGHALAVGLSIEKKNLEAFKNDINKIASEKIYDESAEEVAATIDCEVDADMLTLDAVKSLSIIEPYGLSNPQPVFLLKDAVVDDITPIRSDKHLKLRITSGKDAFICLLFDANIDSCNFVQGDKVDIVFCAEINDFQNRQNVQLIIKQIERTQAECIKDEESLELYEKFVSRETLSTEEISKIAPTKEEIVSVWRHVKTNMNDKEATCDLFTLCRKISREMSIKEKHRMNPATMLVCLDVFAECNLFEYSRQEKQVRLKAKKHEGKADISRSEILARIRRMKRA